MRARRTKAQIQGRARAAVAKALRLGTLTRPERCQRCGLPAASIDAHHHRGYGRKHWLDVRWLCRYCHSIADGWTIADSGWKVGPLADGWGTDRYRYRDRPRHKKRRW